MIKLTATALVHSISPLIEIHSKTGGQPFQKRDLILDDSWDKDGNHYANFVLIEFMGEKMSQLDTILPGQRVTVEARIRGREAQNRIFNSIVGDSVRPYQPQQAQTATPQQPQGAYPPQYQQAPPQQPYAQQPGYSQPPQQPYAQPAQYGAAAYPPQQPGYTQQQAYPQQQGNPTAANLPFQH